MAIEQRNYDPAVMYGAQHNITVDLGDVLDSNANEILEFDAVASAVNFLRIANAATAGAVTVSARGDDTNVGLTINSLLTGALTLDSTSTGAIDIGISAFAKTITIGNATGATALAFTTGSGGAVVTSTDDNAWTVGANGATNPVLQVNAATASVATGVSVTGAAAGSKVAIAALSSGTNEAIDLDGKGTGTVNVAMVTTSGGIRWKRSVLASSGNTTMTSAMSGSIMLLDGAGVDYTLPAIGAGDVGMEFWFVSTVLADGTFQTITAGAADLLTGGVMCMSTAAGLENDAFSPDVTDDLIITMNGTTQGGIIGSTWHLIAISATRWYCDGTTLGSGTLVTPFS